MFAYILFRDQNDQNHLDQIQHKSVRWILPLESVRMVRLKRNTLVNTKIPKFRLKLTSSAKRYTLSSSLSTSMRSKSSFQVKDGIGCGIANPKRPEENQKTLKRKHERHENLTRRAQRNTFSQRLSACGNGRDRARCQCAGRTLRVLNWHQF